MASSSHILKISKGKISKGKISKETQGMGELNNPLSTETSVTALNTLSDTSVDRYQTTYDNEEQDENSAPPLNDTQLILTRKINKISTSSENVADGTEDKREEVMSSDVDSDLVKLESLTEDSILRTLNDRYSRGLFYTHAGMVLVAMNPSRDSSYLYGSDVLQCYSMKGSKLGVISALPPHPFQIAMMARAGALGGRRSQTVLVSGESGAGKTITTGIILGALVNTASKWMDMRRSNTKNRSLQQLDAALLEAGPLLESFGNARTTRNANSSRFGRLLRVHHSTINGAILGGRIDTYLLEKTRVLGDGGPNFHIFYQLLHAGIVKCYDDGKDFRIISDRQLHNSHTGNHENVKAFEETRHAMKAVGIDEAHVFQLLEAVLYLGDVDVDPVKKTYTKDIFNVLCTQPVLLRTAELLSVPVPQLADLLARKRLRAGHDEVTVPMSYEARRASRDSLCKAIYESIFHYLISCINQRIGTKSIRGEGKEVHEMVDIALVDIYGFENFSSGNSLEQFAINFANEMLHAHYVDAVFRREQAEYVAEGITWSPVSFVDNDSSIVLIKEALSLLDQEVKLARRRDDKTTTERGFTSSLPVRRPGDDDHTFRVIHFAGNVRYDTRGWVAKNQDAVPDGLRELFESSSVLSNLPLQVAGKTTTMSRFQTSLRSLVGILDSSESHYIKCIKPGESLKAQLEAGGVLQTVRLSSARLPRRISFDFFLERYGVICPKDNNDIKEDDGYSRRKCLRIIKTAVGEEGNYTMAAGTTKLFYDIMTHDALEHALVDVLVRASIRIQTFWRARVMRHQYVKVRSAIITLQQWWRSIPRPQPIVRIKGEDIVDDEYNDLGYNGAAPSVNVYKHGCFIISLRDSHYHRRRHSLLRGASTCPKWMSK